MKPSGPDSSAHFPPCAVETMQASWWLFMKAIPTNPKIETETKLNIMEIVIMRLICMVRTLYTKRVT